MDDMLKEKRHNNQEDKLEQVLIVVSNSGTQSKKEVELTSTIVSSLSILTFTHPNPTLCLPAPFYPG